MADRRTFPLGAYVRVLGYAPDRHSPVDPNQLIYDDANALVGHIGQVIAGETEYDCQVDHIFAGNPGRAWHFFWHELAPATEDEWLLDQLTR